MKKPILVAVLVLLALAGFFSWRHFGARADTGLVLYGNVDIRQVSLAFDNSDRVLEMRVEEGDRVKPGQVLARLDTRALVLQADQAQAQVVAQEQALQRLHNGSRPEEIAQAAARLESARAAVELAEQRLQRLKGIAADTASRGVSQDDLDAAASQAKAARSQAEDAGNALRLARIGPRREDIDLAQAQLQATRATLALLQYRISQAELKTPSAGVVRARLLEPGDMASPQRPAYTLALTDPKWVRAYVTESQLGRVRMGQSAQVFTDSYPGQPVAGRIGYISSVAEFTPKSVQTEELRTSLVYEVRVLVDDADDRLRMGMPATVRLAEPAPAGTAAARDAPPGEAPEPSRGVAPELPSEGTPK